MCSAFGIYKEARKVLLRAMQTVAIQCSHFIFLCRFQQSWTPQSLRDTWSTPPGLRKKVSSAKEDSNETCLKDGAQGSFNQGNTTERPTMHQAFADISAGMLEEMLPNCHEEKQHFTIELSLKKSSRARKRKETSLDGTVMSMLNFDGLGPARASKSSNITTGKTVVTILMTTCYNHEECFAVFPNFNFLTAGGAIADVLPLSTGVTARVRDPAPFF